MDSQILPNSNLSKDEIETLEKKIGFKPTPISNYLFTYYNHSTMEREILFDGAVPLHEVTDICYDFFLKFINMPNPKNKTWYLSVILQNSECMNLIILNSSENKEERIKMCEGAIKKFIEIFDITFNVFVSPDNKLIHKYRNDTLVKHLVDSYIRYKALKPKLLQLTK